MQVTRFHFSDVLLEQARQEGDVLADAAYAYLRTDPALVRALFHLETNAALDALTGFPGPVARLARSLSFPSWYDPDLFRFGSRVFTTYTFEILTMLGLYALPYCYAGHRGVRVLYHSEKIRDRPDKRLPETAQFVFDVSRPHAFDPSGRGRVAILKVRLVHAAVRHAVSGRITDEVPVNQEDLAGTNLAFSLIVIRGLRKVGIALSNAEAEAHLHRWNVIGAMLGVKADLIPPSVRQAGMLEKRIRERQFRPSKEGRALTRSLMEYLDTRSHGPMLFRPSDLSCWLLGREVGRILGMRSATGLRSGLSGNLVKVTNFFKSFSAPDRSTVPGESGRNFWVKGT